MNTEIGIFEYLHPKPELAKLGPSSVVLLEYAKTYTAANASCDFDMLTADSICVATLLAYCYFTCTSAPEKLYYPRILNPKF